MSVLRGFASYFARFPHFRTRISHRGKAQRYWHHSSSLFMILSWKDTKDEKKERKKKIGGMRIVTRACFHENSITPYLKSATPLRFTNENVLWYANEATRNTSRTAAYFERTVKVIRKSSKEAITVYIYMFLRANKSCRV